MKRFLGGISVVGAVVYSVYFTLSGMPDSKLQPVLEGVQIVEPDSLVAKLPGLPTSVQHSIKIRNGMMHMSVQEGIVKMEMVVEGKVCGSLNWPVAQPVSFSANQCRAWNESVEGYDHCAKIVPVSVLHKCSYAVSDSKTYGPPCILHMQNVGRIPLGNQKPCILRKDQHVYWELLSAVRTPTLIDIGAHDGENINAFAHYGVKVFAFEPSHSQYNVQFITKSLNTIADSSANSVAQGMLPFDGGVGPIGRGIASQLQKKHTHINMYDLSKIVREPVGLLKMDCEGCEPKALSTAVKLICVHGVEHIFTEFFPKAIAQTSSGWTAAGYLAFLQDLGFHCKCWVGFSKKNTIDCAPKCVDPMQDPAGFVHEVMGCKRKLFDLSCKRVRPPSQKLCQANGV